jgi:hypothetical protein
MLEQHRRHLGEWRAESERHVRALIEHQRGVEARLAEAGEYLRIREDEVRALTDEVKQLKQMLAQVLYRESNACTLSALSLNAR